MPNTVNCPHCHKQFESAQDASGGQGACPHCGGSGYIPPVSAAAPPPISASGPPLAAGQRCPKCGSGSLGPGPWPWYLGTIGAMLVRAMVCYDCGHHFDANKPQADLAQRKMRLALIINGLGGLGIIVVVGLLYLWLRAVMI
ncbi:MAG: hypothetical protein IIA67_06615 [Planctomycetes bacterium]|nr:hypothetical protein [Planctomycetota bacterium]